jgi:hypothetical protein
MLQRLIQTNKVDKLDDREPTNKLIVRRLIKVMELKKVLNNSI